MKKALFYIVFAGIIVSFSSTVFAASSCAPGDKFDIFTGKTCVVSTAVDKDAQILALQAQVTSLQVQLNQLRNSSATSSVSDKERKLRDIDSQILPLLSKIDTSDIDTYIKNVNTILAYYKITDPDSKFTNLGRAESYAATEVRAETLKTQIENYIKYRSF